MGDLAVGENFVFRFIIVVIFIGLGRAYRLGGGGGVGGGLDFEVTKWRTSHKGMEPFLWGKLTPQDTI